MGFPTRKDQGVLIVTTREVMCEVLRGRGTLDDQLSVTGTVRDQSGDVTPFDGYISDVSFDGIIHVIGEEPSHV